MQQLHDHVTAQWDAAGNLPAQPHHLGRSSLQQVWLHYNCNIHRRLMTVKAASQNGKSLLCKMCGHKPASEWEQQAYHHLQNMDVGEIVHESKLLRGKYGAADIYLPKYHLIIMIDGEGHNCTDHHNKHVAEQVERDKRFNAAVANTNYHLLRVAWQDMRKFRHLVAHVVTKISAGKGQVIVLSDACLELQS